MVSQLGTYNTLSEYTLKLDYMLRRCIIPVVVRVGVDVGGTFTDIVVFNEEAGVLTSLKVLTTPRRPVEAIARGLDELVRDYEEVKAAIHATTLGTNLFFGQAGIEPPEVILITNRGLEDVIEIGRQNRPELYNLFFDRPKPLVPRDKRYGVRGRLDPQGNELEPIDPREIKAIAKKHCAQGEANRITVFAVSLLHSYRNPTHEVKVKQIIREICPGSITVLSSEADPQPMEYERTSTTVVNAILKPVLSKYLEELLRELQSRGFRGQLLVMQSSGGVASVEEAVEKPAAFIESGPSAGAVAVAYFSRLQGVDKALGFDMGGTTAKASSIVGGEPEVTTLYEVGGKMHMGRLVRGSGYPVRYPYIDLAEVSAGGGTIAWIDAGGALRIGPMSAGADPGPACYARGGRDATITDANLLLGRLPEKLAGGRVSIKKELAEEAVEKLSSQLGLDVVETAWAIVKLANTVMAKALRLVSIEKGHDPREFSLYAFGGAGPLHAVELGEELGVKEVIVPPEPGVFSALGLLFTDYKHYLHAPVVKRTDKISDKDLENTFRKLEEKAHRILESEGVPAEKRALRRFIEAKYWGQGYTLRVPYMGSVEATTKAFHELHSARYGFSSPEEPVEYVVAAIEAIGATEKPVLHVEKIKLKGRVVGEREVFFERGWEKTTIYQGYPSIGEELVGPVVVELPDSTVLVPPGYVLSIDKFGSLHITRIGG